MATERFTVHGLKRLLEKKIPHPYPHPQSGTPAAVLMLISAADQSIVLMKRPTQPTDPHSGQIAFPGGRIEEQDLITLEDMRIEAVWERAALREFHEETGAQDLNLELIGHLPEIATTTGYVIHPIVALTNRKLSLEIFDPDPHEVEALILPRLSDFQDPSIHRVEMKTHNGREYPIHFFDIQGNVIWGATAAILYNFVKRFKD